MVKGLSRKVVMVHFPGPGVFEQALFVVREDAATNQGVSAEDVVSEACRIAHNHTPRFLKKKIRPFPPLFYFLAGSGSVGIAWCLTLLFG